MHSLHILHVSCTLLMKSLNLWTGTRRVTHCGMSAETGPVVSNYNLTPHFFFFAFDLLKFGFPVSILTVKRQGLKEDR